MPYKIVKQGAKFCLTKEDTGKLVPGGCHATRAEAVDHMQAIGAAAHAHAVAQSFIEDDGIELDIDAVDEDGYEVYAIGDDETVWSGPIAFEGVATGDNREFAENSVTFDELPLPFLWQRSSTDGHGGSVVIGRLDEVEKKENTFYGRGVILNTESGNEYKQLVEAGAAGGVSIDGDNAQYSVSEEEDGKSKISFSCIRVRGLTAVAIPAFNGAKIKLFTEDDPATDFCAKADCEGCHEDHEGIADFKKKERKRKKSAWNYSAEEVLLAAAPVRPPMAWFNNPTLPGPTPLTVLENGQVFGHLALWGTCHIGMPACTKPPKGGTYGYFHTGALDTAEAVEVSVGHLTFNTGHASMNDNAYSAASHYDHTGTVAADVVAGEDAYGIWVSGAMRPHLSDEDVRSFKSAPLSGDWRRIGSRMELVGALSVNTPGFPVPRSRTQVLVASGNDTTFISTLAMEDYDTIGRTVYKEDLSARVEEFYNKCHGEGGLFCEGPDGPGRLRDNTKKSERVVGEKAPQWMKNMLSRKRGAASKKGASLLPKDSPQYMKDLMERRVTSGLSLDQDPETELDLPARVERSGDMPRNEDYDIQVRAEYAARRQALRAQVEEFYNKCHGEGGLFCEGPDGPGRVRDNGKEKPSVSGEVNDPSGKMGGRDSGGKPIEGGRATSTAKNETTKSHPSYQKAHDLMAENQAQLEKAVDNAKTSNDKKYYQNELNKMRQERIRWAVEADRLGERVERMQRNLEAAKTAKSGDAATDRRRLREAKDFVSGAERDLRGYINNKIGSYTGFADDPKPRKKR